MGREGTEGREESEGGLKKVMLVYVLLWLLLQANDERKENYLG